MSLSSRGSGMEVKYKDPMRTGGRQSVFSAATETPQGHVVPKFQLTAILQAPRVIVNKPLKTVQRLCLDHLRPRSTLSSLSHLVASPLLRPNTINQSSSLRIPTSLTAQSCTMIHPWHTTAKQHSASTSITASIDVRRGTRTLTNTSMGCVKL